MHLSPCRNGGHLESCKEIDCNIMFKCPNYYCIPWNYVCDGKWDCPRGIDEDLLHGCNINRKCSNLFKCRKTNLCIHLGSLCNGNVDCPYGDDEFTCDLQHQICSFNCDCFLLVIRCINVAVNPFVNSKLWPYKVVLFQKSNFFIDDKMKGILSNVEIFVISDSGLRKVCYLMDRRNFLSVDFSFNFIYQLETGCFENIDNLKFIELTNNFISKIHKLAFSSLPSLIFIDLSQNFLTSLDEHIIVNSPNVVMLSLVGNTLINLNEKSFQYFNGKIIHVTDSYVCCFIPKAVQCTTSTPWYKSCSNLLWHNYVTQLTGFISFLVLFVNLLSIVFQNSLMMSKFSHGFATIVLAMNLGEITLGSYLLVIWMVDLYYSRFFVLSEKMWLSSFQCYILQSIIFNIYLLSPLIQCFLTLTRLMVTMFPMSTRFQNRAFILRGIICIWLCTGILSILKMLYMFIDGTSVPFRLCFSLIDPAHIVSFSNMLVWTLFFYYVILSSSMLLMHFKLYISLRISERNACVNTSEKRKKSVAQILMKITVIMLSCLLSWLPSNTVFVIILFKEKYPVEMII